MFFPKTDLLAKWVTNLIIFIKMLNWPLFSLELFFKQIPKNAINISAQNIVGILVNIRGET